MAAARMDVMIATPSPNADVPSQLIEAAARNPWSAAYGRRELADAGGLIAHGASRDGVFARAPIFVDRILKGADPTASRWSSREGGACD